MDGFAQYFLIMDTMGGIVVLSLLYYMNQTCFSLHRFESDQSDKDILDILTHPSRYS